jgi:hypothetical protein
LNVLSYLIRYCYIQAKKKDKLDIEAFEGQRRRSLAERKASSGELPAFKLKKVVRKKEVG